MKQFTRLLSRIKNAGSPTIVADILCKYFNSVTPQDALWAIAFCAGRRPKRLCTADTLKQWALEYSHIPEWLYAESLSVSGDICETIACLFPPTPSKAIPDLSGILTSYTSLGASNENEKKQFVQNSWHVLDYPERFIFNKIITGRFRVTVEERILSSALSKFCGNPAETMAFRLKRDWKPEITTFNQVFVEPDPSDEISLPYQFKEVAPGNEDFSVYASGSWEAEWLWDGVRVQFIRRQGKIFLWSKDRNIVNEKFPEFSGCETSNWKDFVMDGEMVAIHGDGPLPKSTLMKRFGRKRPSRKLITDIPVVYLAFDLLELNGEDIRHLPRSERLAHLDATIAGINNDCSLFNLSIPVFIRSKKDIESMLDQVRAQNARGIVLKKLAGAYPDPSVPWSLIKPAPLVAFCVLAYVNRGNSRSSSVSSELTLGVWDAGSLVAVAKLVPPMDGEELDELESLISQNIEERVGPVRILRPAIVFEISFDQVVQSSRHKSGLKLMNTSFIKWHKEMDTSNGSSLNDLKTMLP